MVRAISKALWKGWLVLRWHSHLHSTRCPTVFLWGRLVRKTEKSLSCGDEQRKRAWKNNKSNYQMDRCVWELHMKQRERRTNFVTGAAKCTTSCHSKHHIWRSYYLIAIEPESSLRLQSGLDKAKCAKEDLPFPGLPVSRWTVPHVWHIEWMISHYWGHYKEWFANLFIYIVPMRQSSTDHSRSPWVIYDG